MKQRGTRGTQCEVEGRGGEIHEMEKDTRRRWKVVSTDAVKAVESRKDQCGERRSAEGNQA